MAKIKLTASRIADFQCADGRAQDFLWCADVAGLAVRATARSNVKRYIFQAKVKRASADSGVNKAVTMRVTIGKVSIWSIEDAKAEARRLQVEIDKGYDPRQQEKDKHLAETIRLNATKQAAEAKALKDKLESVKFDEAWQEYISERKEAKEGKENSWSVRHYSDHLKLTHIGGIERKRSKKLTAAGPLASFLDLKLVDITPEKVTEWADVEANKRPTQARLAFRLLRAFLSWCMKHRVYKQIVKDNAAKNDVARKRLGKPQTKSDVLQREQLPAWFSAVKQINNPVIAIYLQTLLLTGRRREQIAQLKWSDIDFQWNKITMKDKTERNASIPLTPYVASLLRTLPRRNEFVFSSPTAKAGYLADPSDAHRKACAEAGVDLTLHGLRRSFATLCEWIEMPSGIAAQIQGHAPQGVREQNYIRRSLDLLRMWHIKIEEWILREASLNI
jgi:integrase